MTELGVKDIPTWAAFIVFLIPLFALAGSAVAYVVKLFQDSSSQRHARFFSLMEYIDDRNRPIATKVAAIYELRRFTEHREFIIRFCETQRSNISGTSASILIDEMDRTRDFMRNR